MKIILIHLLIFLCLSVKAQVKLDSISLKEELPINWTVYMSNEDVEISYKSVECDPPMGYDKEMILFKIENKTTFELVVDWHMIMYFSMSCKTCNYPDEYHYYVTISPSSIVTGNCDIDSDYQLKVFSKFIDENYSSGSQLTSFEMRNLNIQVQ